MRIEVSSLVALVLPLAACDPADGEFYDDELHFRSGGDEAVLDVGSDDDGGTRSDARPGQPGGGGGWISNGLGDPGVGGIDPTYPLGSPHGLSETTGVLSDPQRRGIAEYVVECALPAGRSITKVVDGQAHVLDGLLGLAPEW